MFGELALLYDAPRSATVVCVEDSDIWSLERDLFKYIQAVSASAQIMQRSRWLANSPDLQKLPPIDLSKLISTMQVYLFELGDFLYKDSKVTKRCMLIEKGVASVYAPLSLKFVDAAAADKALQIFRPINRRQSINQMSVKQLSSYMQGNSEDIIDHHMVLCYQPHAH